MRFEQSLKRGRIAESRIATWLLRRGAHVLPAYEIEIPRFKGPQFYSSTGSYASPDLLVFAADGMLWVEAKHKSVFSWHRLTQRWTTGIDLHHYEQYQEVARLSGLPVWLLFLHSDSAPHVRDLEAGCPPECPTGLFGNELSILVRRENHRAQPLINGSGHGRTGMVYWARDSLRLLAKTA